MNRPTALITGASSGIGLDLARMFAANGHDLVLVARSEGKLQELAVELEKRHEITAHVAACDLARPDAAKQLVEEVKERGIEIDVLVNNAGFGLKGPFAENDLQRELDMIQVNVIALTALTKLLLEPMLARRRGRILNVSSTAAFVSGPFMAIYYATKAYVLSFSEALADELRDSGVTVTVLCPGPTATAFADVAGMTQSRLFTMMRPMASARVASAAYRGLMSGKRLVLPGAFNKALIQSLRVSPRRVVTTVARKFQESR